MKITVTKDCLEIVMQGREQVWALRAKVKVPLDTITSVDYAERWQDWRKWEVRMPGTGAPTKLLAGSFWTEQGWDFLYIKNQRRVMHPVAENVLVITTTQDRYRRVIVSCAPEKAKELLASLKR